MAYSTGAFPSAAAARLTLRPLLTDAAAGFTLVSQDVAFTANTLAHHVDVYRSPAASNIEGKDWYLAVIEWLNNGQRILRFAILEGWDPVANKGTRYSPLANNIAPAADGSVGATAAGPEAFAGPAIGWPDTGTSFILTADANRVMFSLGIPGASSQTLYAGLMDRMHPEAVDGFPLVGINLTSGSNNPSAGYGWTTREPGQGSASTMNFRTQLTGYTQWDRLFIVGSYTSAEAISGRQILSPCVVHASRNPTNSARGLLRGPKMGTAAAGPTDTLTETALDGTTRSYYCTFPYIGLFVPKF